MNQLFFLLAIVGGSFYAFRNFSKIYRNINLGLKDTSEKKSLGDTAQRWRNVVLVALGQKKMFKNWIPAVLHLFIYVAFVITQIELIEILVDGTFGVHRFFAKYLGGFYTFIISFIEVLSVLAFIATIAFLTRRFVLKVARFQKPELKGFPTRDAATILILEIILIVAIFCMNGADTVLQERLPEKFHHTGFFTVTGWMEPFLFGNLSTGTLIVLERLGWWMHILLVLGYLNYLPFSKHLHIILAFFNTYYARLTPRGEMENMPAIMHEVKNMLGLPADAIETSTTNKEEILPIFGANDITSLSWKDILGAYSCTECGRCTAVCPANITGKKLSPRKIMMDVRDRVEEVGRKLDTGDVQFINKETHATDTVLSGKNFSDGRSLFNFIEPEELHACTTCNACIEACPILINPLDIILKMRRYEILTLSQGPTDLVPMFTSLENSGSVWQMQMEREAWTKN